MGLKTVYFKVLAGYSTIDNRYWCSRVQRISFICAWDSHRKMYHLLLLNGVGHWFRTDTYNIFLICSHEVTFWAPIAGINYLFTEWCLVPSKFLILFLVFRAVNIVSMGIGKGNRRRAIGFLRDINLCEWSNDDHRVSFCVKIFSSFGWSSVAITSVKVFLRHVFFKCSHQVSSCLISANDVRALHCKSVVIYVFFRSSNAELRASFPDDLGEVACAAWVLCVVEVIARIADLIVPNTVIFICEKLISNTRNIFSLPEMRGSVLYLIGKWRALVSSLFIDVESGSVKGDVV